MTSHPDVTSKIPRRTGNESAMCQHWQKFLNITGGLSLSFQLSLAIVLNLDLKVFLATLNRFSVVLEIESKLFVSSALAGVNRPSFLLQVKVSLVKCTLV